MFLMCAGFLLALFPRFLIILLLFWISSCALLAYILITNGAEEERNFFLGKSDVQESESDDVHS